MSPTLYFDLETIPTQLQKVRAAIAESVTHPSTMSKPETIAAWVADKKPAAVEEAIAKTSFDGAYGHICCIGWAYDDEPAQSLVLETEVAEADILHEFAMILDGRMVMNRIPTIVGHNVINFDIRFIWQRAIILGIELPRWFPRDPSPYGSDVFDTMLRWDRRRENMVGMDRLCEVMGLPGKGDIDGSMIGKLWEAGEYDRIAEYCKADIERTRAIHKRMQIAFGEVSQVREAAE